MSLVLGSGGARGLAHIGVIRELEAQGFDVRSIVGCSMGALVGGFYAAGQLEHYERWVLELSEWDVLRFLDVSLHASAGMLKGDVLMDELRKVVGDRSIESLAIPFTAVATDLMARKEVWLRRGPLFDAIRASIAIPGIFTPQLINGRMLVDGGLLNPLPVAPATDREGELTIAVSLNGQEVSHPLGPDPAPVRAGSLEDYQQRIDRFLARIQTRFGIEQAPPQPPPMGLTDVLISAFDTMQSTISRFRLAAYPPDLVITIPRNVCRTQEFYKAQRVIEAGRYWTRQQLTQLAS